MLHDFLVCILCEFQGWGGKKKSPSSKMQANESATDTRLRSWHIFLSFSIIQCIQNTCMKGSNSGNMLIRVHDLNKHHDVYYITQDNK